MWGFIKSVGRAISHGVKGALSSLIHGLGWLVHRFIFGIPELIISLLGFKPRKKMRLKVLILLDANNKPIASPVEVESVVQEAQYTFRHQANVRIIAPKGEHGIVSVFPDPAPQFVMTPKCDAGGFKHIFTRVGEWYRIHSDRYAYKGGVTMFVVQDVLGGKAGCMNGPLVDYGYIDDGALRTSSGQALSLGMKLTLAHELGHSCDLLHRDNARNLMEPTGYPRTRHLTLWQRSVLRSSQRVRYF